MEESQLKIIHFVATNVWIAENIWIKIQEMTLKPDYQCFYNQVNGKISVTWTFSMIYEIYL